MVAHGLITGMLFFVAGSVKERFHTLEIKRLGGLLLQAPRMGWILGFCAMASLGLPGLAGFWGEFPAILSRPTARPPGLQRRRCSARSWWSPRSARCFAAGYLLWMFQRVAFGTPKEEFERRRHIHDVHVTEWLAWAPMLVLIVVLGVVPDLIFHVTDAAVHASLQRCARSVSCRRC